MIPLATLSKLRRTRENTRDVLMLRDGIVKDVSACVVKLKRLSVRSVRESEKQEIENEKAYLAIKEVLIELRDICDSYLKQL